MGKIPKEAVEQFVNKLSAELSHGNLSGAIRAVTTFRFMYLNDHGLYYRTIEEREMQPRKVLVLDVIGRGIVICNEYYPEDYGRVHIIPDHQYGQFHRDDMSFEYRKAVSDVRHIVYEGEDWPEGVGEPSVENILTYFQGEQL